MRGLRSASFALAGALSASALFAAGIVWLAVAWLSFAWDGGLPNVMLAVMYSIRIVAIFGMLIMLCIGIRSIVRAISSTDAITNQDRAFSYFLLIVIYVAFGMTIPMPGIGFFEPPVYLGVALLLLLVVQVQVIMRGQETSVPPHFLGAMRPDGQRATMATLLAIAAVLGASGAYAWLAVRGDVMDCFAWECAPSMILAVMGLLTVVGVATAFVVVRSLRTKSRVTTPGIIATTLYACLALVALALPAAILMPYDFYVAAFWHALAALTFLICQSSLDDDAWPLPTSLVMESGAGLPALRR